MDYKTIEVFVHVNILNVDRPAGILVTYFFP